MFVDEAEVTLKAGRGGDGLTSFRREKYVAKGGPDGGDGGDGGDIAVRADNNANTLAKLRYKKVIQAKSGEKGKRRKAHGKSAEATIIEVPVGTSVYEGDRLLADLVEPGQEAVIASGGQGGFGNAHFVTSTRQAPRMAELGESGEEKQVRFELKTVADVGLIGLPNAGKSTLLSVISNAKPKIADYPFTTLEPNLGVVDIFGDSLVFADIPGLIAGASQGKGLGDDFLRHIERTKVLLHLIDAGSDDLVRDYQVIQRELTDYKIDLTLKPQLVALTKTDAVADIEPLLSQLRSAGVEDVYPVSSIAHKGLDDVLKRLFETVVNIPTEVEKPESDIPTITLADDPESWWVEAAGSGKYKVHGQKIGRFAERTDFSNREAMTRLRDIFKKRGIDRELVRLGIKKGDTVKVGPKEFDW